MTKRIVGVVLAGLAMFVWGMVSWMVLPWHDKTIKTLPEEQLISDTLKVVVPESGLYAFPSDRVGDQRLEQQVWAEKYKKGPIGMLVFSPGGKDPMGGSTLVVGLFANVMMALILYLILLVSRDRVQGFLPRVGLAAGLGFLAWVSVHVPYWNWFNFPANYTLVNLFDLLIGATVAGTVLHFFVPATN